MISISLHPIADATFSHFFHFAMPELRNTEYSNADHLPSFVKEYQTAPETYEQKKTFCTCCL